jgi:hypothetical protein
VSPFSRRATILIVGVSSLSLACALLFAVVGGDPTQEDDYRPGVHSPSALGHRAFAEMLRRLGVDVVVSHHASGAKAGEQALLIAAEPAADDLAAVLAGADTSLVVLPKRTGTPDAGRRTWIDSSSLLPIGDVDQVLFRAIGVGGRVVRLPALVLPRNPYGAGPTLASPQAVVSDDLEPVIAGPDGILLGVRHRDGRAVWILSDPDLIANHGIGAGDNAPLAFAIVDDLRRGRPVVIDETLHGREQVPSLWSDLFRFPLVCVAAATLLAVAIGLWAGVLRFGAPVPVPPPVERGKRLLIAHTAELLDRGGHAADALARYLHTTLTDVARATHAPPDLDGARLREWLEQLARARGVRVSLAELDAAVAEAARAGRRAPALVAAAAARIYSFRQDMTGGAT